MSASGRSTGTAEANRADTERQDSGAIATQRRQQQTRCRSKTTLCGTVITISVGSRYNRPISKYIH